jgi:hypothetical protein
MFRFCALVFMVVFFRDAQSQLLVNYPYNPDEDNNQLIGSPDLLGFLSYYGEAFTPDPILVDSTDLGSVLTSMQQTIAGLQTSVATLQAELDAFGSSSSDCKPYKLVVNISGGTVNSITALYDPSGANILGVGGWSVAANSPSPNSVRITHPLGVPLTDFFSLGINGAEVKTRSFIQLLTSQYSVIQNSSFTTATVYSISAGNAGFASAGSGDLYMLYFRADQ